MVDREKEIASQRIMLASVFDFDPLRSPYHVAIPLLFTARFHAANVAVQRKPSRDSDGSRIRR